MKTPNKLPDTMLAPLAGFTDAGFRALASNYRAGITVTEMVSAAALSYDNRITKDLLYLTGEETFPSLQLFGHDEYAFEKALEAPQTEAFPLIDINMGCPMPKIVRNGDGVALMLNPEKAAAVIKAVKKHRPLVSVKIRTGINDASLAEDFARVCEQAGADFLTVHGRFARQLYSGNADYSAIAKVVKAVSIPVYANGDVVDERSFDSIRKETGCYGVAIGRGALGKPYIFSQLKHIDYSFDIYSAVCRHIDVLSSFLPPNVVANTMKKHICHYIKGLKGNKPVIVAVQQATDTQSIKSMLANFLV